MAANTLHAEQIRFFVGTYTQGTTSKGIYTGLLDNETGKLEKITLAAEARNPGFLTLSPDGNHLYGVLDGPGSAAAFRCDTDGKLPLLNELHVGREVCHVSIDKTGRNVLVADYSGSITCLQTKEDGSLDRITASIHFTGSGPNHARQAGPHAHSIYPDENDRFVYACDLGTDNIWVFKFDPANGSLTPADPPSAKVPPGAGPRHLAFLPNGRFAYSANEMGINVTAFSREPETGTLTPFQTIQTLPDGASTKGVTTSEIACHPSGKWLYVANRGHDSITVFSVGEDGGLSWVQNVPAGVSVPRGFTIDPSGRWMVAAGQKDNRIAVLAIDPKTGRLSDTQQSAEIGAPVCVVFEARGGR